MKRRNLFCCAAVSLLALTTANAQTKSGAAIPQSAVCAGRNQSGSCLIFGADGPTIQHVKLYRYH